MCRASHVLIFSTLLPVILLGSLHLHAAESYDESRLKGFAEHQKENKQYDKSRDAGEVSWLEEQEQWDEARRKQGDAYKRERKAETMDDDGPEAKNDEKAKAAYRKEMEDERKTFVARKEKAEKEIARGTHGIPTEAQELGLDEERPRYDYRKRASFGGKSQWKGSSASGGGGSSFGRGGGGFGGGGSLPPPPTFDDIDNGYVPAPNMDDFGDIPPPPPPPPPAYDNDFGGGTGGGDFIPPPPPPAGFGDDPDF